MVKNKYIPSPLNYTGGKFKLLSQIEPLFPDDITNFIDLFAGGCNVGINAKAAKVIFNDRNSHLKNLFSSFQNLDKDDIFKYIYTMIYDYNLSDTSLNGYDYYNCNSKDGLGVYNKKGFIKLREKYNKTLNKGYYEYIMLYVLIIYSFNNQIRFNSKDEYNLPVGKRDFNLNMKNKLSLFIDKIKDIDCIFQDRDFRNFDYNKFDKNTFFYVDPPYLISCATYNEQSAWSETDEKDLLTFLDELHKKGFRFALSNVLTSKGKYNEILLEWIEENKDKYTIKHLNYSYSNSSYQAKNKDYKTDEVLIINYKE